MHFQKSRDGRSNFYDDFEKGNVENFEVRRIFQISTRNICIILASEDRKKFKTNLEQLSYPLKFNTRT